MKILSKFEVSSSVDCESYDSQDDEFLCQNVFVIELYSSQSYTGGVANVMSCLFYCRMPVPPGSLAMLFQVLEDELGVQVFDYCVLPLATVVI